MLQTPYLSGYNNRHKGLNRRLNRPTSIILSSNHHFGRFHMKKRYIDTYNTYKLNVEDGITKIDYFK